MNQYDERNYYFQHKDKHQYIPFEDYRETTRYPLAVRIALVVVAILVIVVVVSV